jgi:large subunit ribosomal protein L20
MPRAKSGTIHRNKVRKTLKATKGFRGARSLLYRTAKDARRRALQNSYIHRRNKKREMRSLWIVRINAAARLCGMSYSVLVNSMAKAGIMINRKMLADIAVTDLKAFEAVVKKAAA